MTTALVADVFTAQAKTTLLWMCVVCLFCSQHFLPGAFAIPRELKGRTFPQWGFPTCPGATDFVVMGGFSLCLSLCLSDNVCLSDSVFVCFSKVQEAATLVTGSTACPEGWTREYPGHLLTWRDDVTASELECVNVTKMATVRSSQHLQGQTLIFYTASLCGRLPWPPYQRDGGVMCAVCSK
ncbi:hypothetical protein ACOMHN_052412 [Nucella lapillus]